MTIPMASLALGVAALYVLWPLISRRAQAGETEPPALEPDDLRGAIEEVELDAASGRLDDDEAGRRLAELGSRPR